MKKPTHPFRPRRKINIAIDGYSSCGKSTLACALAGELGYLYLDTGAMYRAATLFFLRKGIIPSENLPEKKIEKHLRGLKIGLRPDPEKNRCTILMNGKNVENEIRGMEVSAHVSRISKISAVRRKMVALQRAMANKKGVIMEGRDIGTVVLPDAELKLFLIAEPELRARRRYRELKEKEVKVTLNEVRENIRARDEMDTSRKDSPLRKPAGAIMLNNTVLNKKQVLRKALAWVKKTLEE